jgi:uncharacterized protein (TIGR02147 family)
MRQLNKGTKKNHTNASAFWVNTTIREMIGLKYFKPDPDWIANKLFPDISIVQARKSVDILKNNGLIKFDAKSKSYVCLIKTSRQRLRHQEKASSIFTEACRGLF